MTFIVFVIALLSVAGAVALIVDGIREWHAGKGASVMMIFLGAMLLVFTAYMVDITVAS